MWTLCAVFYLWTGTSSGDPSQLGTGQSPFYNLQATAFLHGHLDVPIQAPPGLVSLVDPYDPTKNGPYQGALHAHDLAYYRGHFYLPWGPVPAVTLYAPWHLLNLGDLPDSAACLVYAWVGLAFVLALLHLLLTRFGIRPHMWKVVLAALLLAMGSVVPYLLRSGRVYEVAISSGYCFAMIGLYLLARGGLGHRPRRWSLLFGSLAIGLAAGSRWDLSILTPLLVGLWIWVLRRGGVTRLADAARWGIAVLGPCAVIVALLLAFNVARFGNPLQFGTGYQLAGFDPTKVRYYQFSYMGPSLYYYVAAPVRWTLAFPFFALPPPPSFPFGVPAAYGPEPVGGVLTTTPILLVLFLRSRTLWTKLPSELRWAMTAIVATAIALVATLAFSIPGTTMRYEADFLTLLLLPAVLLWIAWSPAHRGRRLAVSLLGGVVVAYGTLIGLALSTTGEVDSLRLGSPGTYHALQEVTSALPTLITVIEGHPNVVRVIDPRASYPNDRGDYGTYKAGQRFTLSGDREEIDVYCPSTGRYRVTATFVTPAGASAGPVMVHIADGFAVHSAPYAVGDSAVVVTMRGGLNRLFIWLGTSNGVDQPSTGVPVVSGSNLKVTAA